MNLFIGSIHIGTLTAGRKVFDNGLKDYSAQAHIRYGEATNRSLWPLAILVQFRGDWRSAPVTTNALLARTLAPTERVTDPRP
jgi:hypothetical protein